MDGSKPPLSLAFAGLHAGDFAAPASGGGPAGDSSDGAASMITLLGVARVAGIRGVHLDATVAGVRARDLDRSARRDVASRIRRADQQFTGLDLFIPSAHFLDAGRVDRAVTTTLAAIELAADLCSLGARLYRAGAGRGPTVCVVLPEKLPADVVAILVDRGDRCGVGLADHRWPIGEPRDAGSVIGVGLDPATVLAAGEDPAALVSRIGSRLRCARLNDTSRDHGTVRVAPGSPGGRLDLVAYGVALATSGYGGHAILDLRGVQAPADGLRQAVDAWSAGSA